MDVKQAMLLNTSGSEIWAFLFTIDDSRSAKMISSPVETGKYVFDNKVIMPRVIDLRGIIPMAHNGDFENWTPQKCLDDLKKAFEDRSYNTYTVVTKTESIPNLVVDNLRYSYTSEKFDAVDVNITLKELITSKQSYRAVEPIDKPANRDNSNTTEAGIKNLTTTVKIAKTASWFSTSTIWNAVKAMSPF